MQKLSPVSQSPLHGQHKGPRVSFSRRPSSFGAALLLICIPPCLSIYEFNSLSLFLSLHTLPLATAASVQDITRTLPPRPDTEHWGAHIQSQYQCAQVIQIDRPSVRLSSLFPSKYSLITRKQKTTDHFYVSSKHKAPLFSNFSTHHRRQQQYYSPLAFNSSGNTRSVRSGSSPYQKIHSSLAAVNESGGCTTLLGMS